MQSHPLFSSDRLPRKPYCSNDKTASRIRSVASALQYQYIQPNPPGILYWLVFDIDRPDGVTWYQDAIVPTPNIIVTNPENGHAHYFYCLKTPVNIGENGREKPKKWAEFIYSSLAQILGADPCYARLIAKNPLHPAHLSLFLEEQPYELAELDEYIVNRQAGRTWKSEAKKQGRAVNDLGRNCTVFDSLRSWAYSWIGEYKSMGSCDAWHAVCQRQAEVLNSFPGHGGGALEMGEVRAIAKSVAKWVWHKYTGRSGNDPEFPKMQAARGARKGHEKRDQLLTKACAMAAAGRTQREIAGALGASQKTISNWLKRGER